MRQQGVGSRFRRNSGSDLNLGVVTVLAEKSDRKPAARKPASKSNDAALGTALRSVYQQTVEEKVPDEFLDLLGKLD